MDRLNRTRLLLGNDAVKKLADATVMIVGCGAVGSFSAEALARTGVGHMILVDFDVIEESNINRQLFALGSTIGMAKVDAAAARIRDINPKADVTTLNLFWDNGTDISQRPDFVIDAIDSVDSKIALYKWCNRFGIPFISSMGAARRCDMSNIKIAPISKTSVCPLAARIRKIVRTENIPEFDVVYSTVPPMAGTMPGRTFGSLVTVTGTFGLMMANYIINKIIHQ